MKEIKFEDIIGLRNGVIHFINEATNLRNQLITPQAKEVMKEKIVAYKDILKLIDYIFGTDKLNKEKNNENNEV